MSLNFLMKVIGLLILDLIDGNRHERRAALRAFQNVMLGVVLLVVVVPTVWKTMPSGTSLEKQIAAVQWWGSFYGDILQGRTPRVMELRLQQPPVTPKL